MCLLPFHFRQTHSAFTWFQDTIDLRKNKWVPRREQSVRRTSHLMRTHLSATPHFQAPSHSLTLLVYVGAGPEND